MVETKSITRFTENRALYLQMNMKYIEVVEDIFNISGRGCVIVPGIPYSFEPNVKIGDQLEFHNPSGTIIKTTLRGVEMLNRGKPMEHVPFTVDRKVKKGDIEIGAKLYLVSDE